MNLYRILKEHKVFASRLNINKIYKISSFLN